MIARPWAGFGNLFAFATIVGSLPVAGCSNQASSNGQLDSTRAVELAINAYRADGASRPTLIVTRFQRDSGGVLIYLAPDDSSTRGGRALVRVSRGGVASVIQRSQ